MNYKNISNNIAICISVFLVIISFLQRDLLVNLFNNMVGRLLFVLLLIGISYVNKFLGIIVVFVVIIVFSNLTFYEGIENNEETSIKDNTDRINYDIENALKNADEAVKNANDAVKKADQSTIDASKSALEAKMAQTNLEKFKSTISVDTNSLDTSAAAIISPNININEGFDLLGIENNIKRGKNSNSIPVDVFMSNSEFISPYENVESFTIY